MSNEIEELESPVEPAGMDAAIEPEEVAAQAVEAAEDDGETTAEDVAAALEGRCAFYEMLAAIYFLPLKQEQIDSLAATDLSPWADTSELFAEGLNDITRYLRKRNTGTREELAVDFTSAFAGTKVYAGKSAVPYKSVFTSKEGLLCQEGYLDVFKAFKAECVKKREGLDWPDDHLSFLCEFMSLMGKRAGEALRNGDLEAAAHDVDAASKFLQDNILSWFDKLADQALLVLRTRFYRGILKISKAFFLLDAETLDDMAAYIADLAEKKAKEEAAAQAAAQAADQAPAAAPAQA